MRTKNRFEGTLHITKRNYHLLDVKWYPGEASTTRTLREIGLRRLGRPNGLALPGSDARAVRIALCAVQPSRLAWTTVVRLR